MNALNRLSLALAWPAPWRSLALMTTAVFGLSACQREQAPTAPVAVVVAQTVHPQAAGAVAGDSMRYPVEVASRYTTVMSFRVAGKVIERSVRLGDTVHKGQVLARLDPIDAQKQVASSQAALDAASHKVVFAKQQLDRDHAQSARNLIAKNELEQSQDNYTAAVAGRDQAAAQLLLAQNNLQYNSLLADHDGVITSENADTGAVVTAGQAIYGLAWDGDVDVTLDAADTDLARIEIRQNASVTFPSLPGHRYDARVREISPAADPQSRTYRVKLTLLHPGDEVHIGMTGDAVLLPPGVSDADNSVASSVAVADHPNFKIPATAIFHQGKDPAVWVVKPGSAILELRTVAVASYGERTATVTSGLKDGEQIVLAGVHTVFAGQHVKPVGPLFQNEADADGATTKAPGAGTGAAQ